MATFHVSRSIRIQATADKVFDTVADFNTWALWSPWLGLDPEGSVTVSDDSRSVGSTYSWQGEVIGEGDIRHLELVRPILIRDQMKCHTPFNSASTIQFRIASDGNSSKVEWQIDGHLPWFLFWMKGNLEMMIGLDFDRGLQMLREFTETGRVLSSTQVVGAQSLQPTALVGITESTRPDRLGEAIPRALSCTKAKLCEHSQQLHEGAVSIFHSIDNECVNFTAGFQIPPDQSTPGALEKVLIPGGSFLHVRHTGAYDNLGNAWGAAHQYARFKRLKLAKQPGFEIYNSLPNEVLPEDLVTDLYLPLK